MNITPEVNRVLQTICRPTAEKAMLFKAALPLVKAETDLVKNDIAATDDLIDDGRGAEGLKRFSGNELLAALSLMEEIHETYKDDPRWGAVFKLTVRLPEMS